MRKFIITILFVPALVLADTHRPQDFLSSIAGTKHEGKKIVEHYCSTCHAEKPLINLGAPYYKSEWQPRLTQGLDALFKNTNSGKNAMPARGGCFECTDLQLMLAIKALIGADSSSFP